MYRKFLRPYPKMSGATRLPCQAVAPGPVLYDCTRPAGHPMPHQGGGLPQPDDGLANCFAEWDDDRETD